MFPELTASIGVKNTSCVKCKRTLWDHHGPPSVRPSVRCPSDRHARLLSVLSSVRPPVRPPIHPSPDRPNDLPKVRSQFEECTECLQKRSEKHVVRQVQGMAVDHQAAARQGIREWCALQRWNKIASTRSTNGVVTSLAGKELVHPHGGSRKVWFHCGLSAMSESCDRRKCHLASRVEKDTHDATCSPVQPRRAREKFASMRRSRSMLSNTRNQTSRSTIIILQWNERLA